jgi:threonine dehydrogenase-like Zn-dependent dehydrogenase
VQAVVTRPGTERAWAREIPEPTLDAPDDVLVQMLRVGVCGTDRHVMEGFGDPSRQLPPGDDYLVLGHEAVGRVLRVGPDVRFLRAGDVVVPTVRRGCGACAACNANQADLCFTGNYGERGIFRLHGFLAQQIVDREPNLIHVPADLASVAPLVESLCTPEKALRRIANARAHLPVEGQLGGVGRALVTGSGPIALLAVMALRLREIPTCVLARQAANGPAAGLARQVGAEYVALSEVDPDQPWARLGEFDAIIEATGAVELSVLMIGVLARNGVLDLVGGPPERKAVPIHASALGAMVGRNLTLLGSVNANEDDWRAAVADLTAMRQRFPGAVEALITHTFGFANVDVAFTRVPGQIKAVVDVPA